MKFGDYVLKLKESVKLKIDMLLNGHNFSKTKSNDFKEIIKGSL